MAGVWGILFPAHTTGKSDTRTPIWNRQISRVRGALGHTERTQRKGIATPESHEGIPNKRYDE
jgi:hypothetical protein